MKLSVIITAGGIGKRMGSEIPKQFLLVNNKPVLAHTIEAFSDLPFPTELILTLPREWILYWEELCTERQLNYPLIIVEGGKERYHSIKNALLHASGELIAVHDGVRPLIDKATILRLVETAERKGNAIPVKSIAESIRFVDGAESNSVNREHYKIVQTPQVFRREVLFKAYEQPFQSFFTDDSSLVEHLREHIHLVEGNPENIKITTPQDLKLLEIYLSLPD
ncbi:MAG: 2-C-methyl-D-erythritol 4-phosphate cytidylyltransferase [Flavobacteriia bacterium]|nr:2-C-methyl-D-erythritol 4-phosphate cytidylyltransferase [Flavobacteriia bacterium]OJX40126.1 MAG: 2-C-methyl-D-erythritol 4-phosphate cytidylyltransferase [Flavobacteriia bacterium 40-80]